MARPDLPFGIVTFLFSDIEGSTELWDQAPTQMQSALAHHDTLLERSIEWHDGYLVKARGEGDSKVAAFQSPSNALLCALDIQKLIHQEPWTTPRLIRVRIGLHTGEPELRDNDYFGEPVNRAARLRDLASGGQTLLSETTVSLATEQLPEGASFRDLGLHSLRGLTRSERVYQLCDPRLPDRFPPLQSSEPALLKSIPSTRLLPVAAILLVSTLAVLMLVLRNQGVRVEVPPGVSAQTAEGVDLFFVRDGTQISAFVNRSPRNEGKLRWCVEENAFFDPASGDTFDRRGRVTAGDPPRNLDWVETSVEGNQVLVRPTKLHRGTEFVRYGEEASVPSDAPFERQGFCAHHVP